MKHIQILFLWVLLLGNFCANSQSLHSDSLFSVGVSKYNSKQYEEAFYFFSLCDSIDKAEIDSTSNRRDYSSMWIASCYYKLGDTVTAKQISPKYYEFEPIDRRKTIVSDSLSAIADQFFLLGDDSSALEALIQCSRIEKDSLGEYSIWYYNTIMECGYCCYNLGDYESALFFGEEAYRISNRLFDVDSENYFESVCTLINYHGELGDYDIIVEYLQSLENCIDRSNKDVSIILNRLSAIAGYYAAIGDYSEYLRIIRKIMDTYDATTSDVVLLNNLATFLFESGDHESAIKVQTHLIETLTKEPIKDTSVYAIGLSNLAYYYSAIGDYPIAVQLCEKASLCFKNNESNPENITVLNNLANCYYKLGNYEKAIQTARNIIPLCLDIHGDNSIEYSMALNNLATYLSHSETYDINELFSLMDDCIGILENNIDPHDPFFISAICNEGLLFEENGQVRRALQLYNHAVKLEIEEYQDDYYPELALIYYNIASAYDKLNIIDSTLYYLNLSQLVQSNNHMEYTSDYINTLTALFLTYFKNNDIVNMNVCMEKANESLSNKIKHDFPFVSSSERQKYWLLFCDWYYEILPKSLLLDSTERNRRIVFNSLLLSKGLLLATDISINTLYSETDSDEKQKYIELKQLKSLYDKALFEPSINNYNVDSILFSINYLERDLAQSSIILGDAEKQYEIDYKDIQQSLNKDEIAIEFFSLPTDSCDVYYAFCIKNTYDSPRLMRICGYNDLMQLTKQNTLFLKEISQLIWQPLMEELEDINTVYFSPTGVLTTIPIEYAVLNDTEMSMFDVYNIHRLSSLRELTNKRTSQIQSIVLYGGLNYYSNSDVIQVDESEINKTIYAERAFVEDERGGVGELAGSRREVNAITQMLPPSISCHLYSNQNGTETSFKALSGDSISIIHISTHGYYWNESMAGRKRPKHFQSWNTNMLTDEDLALTRSGLYFAGVNKYFLGEELPSYLDDGVLTAQEISKLDLRGTDLVVLSACQTGLGDLKGDGVFGLQRGFKKAGVNSILMSLWKIDDTATELLMVEFYRNYLSGKDKTQSLRNAQKYVREYTDMEGNRIYEHPYYWAGFIMLD